MAEVTSAVIATSLVLISVFIPVSFFPGTTGILYKQFSLTIAFSIAISAFNALTLSPALAAILLRPETKHGGLLGLFEKGMQKVISGYAYLVTHVVKLRVIMMLLFVAGLGSYGLHVHPCAHSLRSLGRPELLHQHRADTSRRLSCLYDGGC